MEKRRTLSDFAKERGIAPQVVTHYMSRHGMRYDRGRGLTPEQEEYLSEQYPLPPDEVVRVVEDTESRKALIEAQQKIIELQSEHKALIEKTARLELLEEKTGYLEDKTTEQAEQIRKLEIEKAVSDKEKELLQSEIDRLKSRSFWERIFNK